jgi:outer membrane biosynthesis protein TonB
MRTFLTFLLFAAVRFSSIGASQDVMLLDEAMQKHLLLVAAKPDYPFEAHGKEGTAIFELKFDYESGHLREIHVVKSIGNRVLDGRAIGALKVWQAKPRSIHTLLVPITFTQSRRF